MILQKNRALTALIKNEKLKTIMSIISLVSTENKNLFSHFFVEMNFVLILKTKKQQCQR